MTMAVVIQDEQLIRRLLDISKQEKRPVEAVIASLVEDYHPRAVEVEDEGSEGEILPGSLAELARAAQRVKFRSGMTDVLEHSRDILDTEFTDYLLRRMRDQGER